MVVHFQQTVKHSQLVLQGGITMQLAMVVLLEIRCVLLKWVMEVHGIPQHKKLISLVGILQLRQVERIISVVLMLHFMYKDTIQRVVQHMARMDSVH